MGAALSVMAILSPAAKADMDKLNREGDNIGSWGTGSARSHDIKFIYEAAEKCRAEGYRQYQNNNLTTTCGSPTSCSFASPSSLT